MTVSLPTMEEGLRYVSDSYYEAPKYHFNTQAAHAFAARVYLYHHDWDKCIEHANAVLGTDDATLCCACAWTTPSLKMCIGRRLCQCMAESRT